MFLIERFWPANDLPKVNHWWLRVVLTNLAQTGIVIVAGFTVDHWMSNWGMNSSWALNKHFSLFWQVLIGYIMITFIYYWWHRLRHESKFFWRLCHQLHHSPMQSPIQKILPTTTQVHLGSTTPSTNRKPKKNYQQNTPAAHSSCPH